MTILRKKFSIFIVEDHEVYRMGLRELIRQEPDLEVVGEADTVRDAWLRVRDAIPDLVILDLSLRDGNGLPLVADLHKLDAKLPVLVLSMYDEALYAERVLAAGAMGYLMKQEASDSIIRAIRRVLAGKVYVSEQITGAMLSRLAKRSQPPEQTPIESLTNRELEIYRMIGEGLKTGEIAKKLHLSVKTVGTYRDRIKEKLNCKSAAELAKRAALWIENTR